MAKVGCRIYTKVDRPEPELVRRFEDYAAADLDDCMGRIASMDCGIKPFNGVKLLGTAVTVNLPSGTNLMFHQALSLAREGDVIVVNAGGDTSRGVCGENMIEIAKERGVRGFVVDGVIRDAAAARAQTDFAVFARGAEANAAFKFGSTGEINVPVAVGGIIVYPGDILVGDEDGIVAIRPQNAAKVLQDVKALAEKQAANLELIKRGVSDRSWLKKMLEEAGCQIIDKAWYEDEV